MRHITLGTMLEHPVPMKINADSDGAVARWFPPPEQLGVAITWRQIAQGEREREREREKVEMRNFACWLAGREREDSKRLTYMKTRTPRKSTVLSVIGHFSSRFPTKALQLKT